MSNAEIAELIASVRSFVERWREVWIREVKVRGSVKPWRETLRSDLEVVEKLTDVLQAQVQPPEGSFAPVNVEQIEKAVDSIENWIESHLGIFIQDEDGDKRGELLAAIKEILAPPEGSFAWAVEQREQGKILERVNRSTGVRIERGLKMQVWAVDVKANDWRVIEDTEGKE